MRQNASQNALFDDAPFRGARTGRLVDPPESDWRPPPPETWPSWDGAQRVCVDIETCDPQIETLGTGVRRDGRVVGVAVAIEDGPAFYLPYDHEGGDNLDGDAVLAYLRYEAKRFRGIVVGANLARYDLDYLEELGVVFPVCAGYMDPLVAEPLLGPKKWSYSLDAVAGYHDVPGKDETLLGAAAFAYGVDTKSGLWRLPARYVGEYAEQDARLPLRLLRLQEPLIADMDLQRVFALECAIIPVVVAMTRRGVAVDHDRLAKVSVWARTRRQEALDELYAYTGVRVAASDVNVATEIERALSAVGVVLPRTEKTDQPQVQAPWLRALGHPAADAVNVARKFDKLDNTFVESVRRYLVRGRIHTTFNAMPLSEDERVGGMKGAITGRFSSSDPNLQQQPNRDEEIGPRWRDIYVPDGDLWASADFSQQEPRYMVHLAEELDLQGAKEAGDAYRDDPDTDLHQFMAEVSGRPRSEAKNVFLGYGYGMSRVRLCREIGYPTKMKEITKNGKKITIEVAGDEGEAAITRFEAQVPWVRKLANKAKGVGRSRGYMKSVLGRRLWFPKNDRGGYDFLHKALNMVVQPSAADQIKTAMVEAHAAGHPLQLQIHDDLDETVESPEQARDLGKIMEQCMTFSVPSKVDVKVGPSWGRLEKLA